MGLSDNAHSAKRNTDPPKSRYPQSARFSMRGGAGAQTTPYHLQVIGAGSDHTNSDGDGDDIEMAEWGAQHILSAYGHRKDDTIITTHNLSALQLSVEPTYEAKESVDYQALMEAVDGTQVEDEDEEEEEVAEVVSVPETAPALPSVASDVWLEAMFTEIVDDLDASN